MHGPNGTGYYQVVSDDGEYEYEGEYDIEYFEDEDELDREGNPLPSPQEKVQIINAIPSYKFEEAKFEESEDMSTSRNQDRPQTTATERKKRNEQRRIEKTVNCSICLDVLKTGATVKALACSHIFHSSCINAWLKEKLECPNCKNLVRF
jgi:heme-binding NEAT domain protein